MNREIKVLSILNVLMSTNGYLTTNQICCRCECNRKTVYRSVDLLEINGFCIDVVRGKPQKGEQNRYKFIGLVGGKRG